MESKRNQKIEKETCIITIICTDVDDDEYGIIMMEIGMNERMKERKKKQNTARKYDFDLLSVSFDCKIQSIDLHS